MPSCGIQLASSTNCSAGLAGSNSASIHTEIKNRISENENAPRRCASADSLGTKARNTAATSGRKVIKERNGMTAKLLSAQDDVAEHEHRADQEGGGVVLNVAGLGAPPDARVGGDDAGGAIDESIDHRDVKPAPQALRQGQRRANE